MTTMAPTSFSVGAAGGMVRRNLFIINVHFQISLRSTMFDCSLLLLFLPLANAQQQENHNSYESQAAHKCGMLHEVQSKAIGKYCNEPNV